MNPTSMNNSGLPFRYPRVLSIAGSDSGGGAGIQADLKTCSALGCYGMTAITAITAQNTRGVTGIHAVPPTMLEQQIDAVMDDIGVDAVKLGMLHDPEVVHVVARAIRRYRWRNVVLDPVMVATSGDCLIAEETVAVLVRELFPLATVVTPNLDEASLLLNRPVREEAQLADAANDLLRLGTRAVLLKGGHLAGERLVDLLLQVDAQPLRLEGARIESRNTHGTGCTLSTAIACRLALGDSLAEAVTLAHGYIRESIAQGADVRTGGGHGPLNHFHAPQILRKLRTA
ncbi:bifunctional hydroxymethylpyrimidine kinase/phosphomethylpyrimidine kinase [Noviherbaspirillum sp.]|uniref:bifunctional hydroxymethylpyrimidine kinase/phosphomethylpyrimidine kinase n=1 Tax=Noviherbaspirillum sp. TaxID=1926288 RepID=UPI002FDFF2AC